MSRYYVPLLTLVAACAMDTREDEPIPAPTSIGTDDSAGDETGDELDPADESDGLPDSGAVDPDDKVGCNAVDFLFVIDNSGSMADEQQALIDSVPGFVESIQERLPPGSGTYHIMVTDVDPWVYGGCEEACQESATCEANSADGSCDCGYPCALRTLCTAGGAMGGDYSCGVSEPAECEDIMGAGVIRPRGRSSSNRDCEFSSGRRYINVTEPDLGEAFDCAARVGTNSSLGEKPMEAMVQAIAGEGDVATCNQGFLRDNAVLVVTIITDEDDNGPNASDLEGDSQGTPADWYDALVAAKNGNDKAIVALGLVGDSDQPGGICQPLDQSTFEGAEPAPRIRQFVEMFGARGKTGSVCASSYEEFFSQTIETIGIACEEFVPEG